MTSDINNPLVSHCFWFTMALKGMEPAPNPQRRGGSKKLEWSSFTFVEGNDSTDQGKTKHT